MTLRMVWLSAALAGSGFAQDYDFLIKNGHVIDGKNHLSAVRDVAIKDGKIAAVAANIAPARAFKTVDAGGLYVTPGLIDIAPRKCGPAPGRALRLGKPSRARFTLPDDPRYL